MGNQEQKAGTVQKQAQEPRENTTENRDWDAKKDKPTSNLPGKTDSGPEPDVFGREIPPQK